MSSGIQMHVELESESLVRSLDDLIHHRVPLWRVEFVRVILKEVLTRTIGRTPVDQGRLRSSWVHQLAQLGGAVPSGWQGEEPDGEEIQKGAEEGEIQVETDEEFTRMDSMNHVEYARFIEYGTGEIEAEHMAGKSLEETLMELDELIPPLIPS